jgi:hypothetical protein
MIPLDRLNNTKGRESRPDVFFFLSPFLI